MQPKAETRVFGDKDYKLPFKGEAPRDVMPEDLAKPKMRMPPEKVESKVRVKRAMGGKVKSYAKGGVTRADGCVTKGHTRGAKR